jgi:hypothetical protein
MRNHRTVLGALATLVVAAALSATPALADGKGRGKGHGRHKDKEHHRVVREHRDHRDYRHRDYDRDYDRRHYYDDHDRHRTVYRTVVRERFVVPHRLVRRHVYDPYFSGSVYFAPHRHAHLVYAFPVYTPYGVEYEPSYYCGDHLYVDHPGYGYDPYYERRRPRVQIGVHLDF